MTTTEAPRTNANGIALIKRFEGLRLKAYLCPAGVWTIGYGHTGPDVKKGMTITEDEAERLLREDLRRFEIGVWKAIKGTPLNSNRFSALVSLAYNIGLGAFSKSSLLKSILRGDMGDVPFEMAAWNKANGKVLPGLVTRRLAEANLWNRGYPNETA